LGGWQRVTLADVAAQPDVDPDEWRCPHADGHGELAG